MCGILALLNNNNKHIPTLSCLSHRGPDYWVASTLPNNDTFIFNRLIINDASENANQPFMIDNNYMMCNGEIFNWKSLAEKYNLPMTTSCDCEVVLQLYNHLKVFFKTTRELCEHLCNELDGEFAFIIYDSHEKLYVVSRDPYGVRPLFIGSSSESDATVFSSELKGIDESVFNETSQFDPGYVMIIDGDYEKKHSFCLSNYAYNSINEIKIDNSLSKDFKQSSSDFSKCRINVFEKINQTFRKAVSKRLMSDKEICCLLSGGLDSSLVCALVASHFPPYTIKSFSIGIKGSPDLEYAQIAADKIKTVHTSIELTELDFLNAIDTVIKTIESYDTTTVRASVGNYLVAKYIKDNTNCKVVFNGDYSDEVCGGYKYLSNCNDPIEFDHECKRLVSNIHYFDSLRSDRCISAHGLEARVPFADKDFIECYFSIPIEWRMSNKNIEKYLLRFAFEKDDLLPPDILWRKKEAFSDGVSEKTRSWHQIITEFVDTQMSDEEYRDLLDKYSDFNKPTLKETVYYRKIFNKYYKNNKIIPYYWLPKYCGDIHDPSAREIENVGTI